MVSRRPSSSGIEATVDTICSWFFVLAALAPDQAPNVISADGTTAIVTANISGDSIEATAKADVIKAYEK